MVTAFIDTMNSFSWPAITIFTAEQDADYFLSRRYDYIRHYMLLQFSALFSV